MPVDGLWKSLLRLHRGAEMMAVPIYLPADPEIDEPEIPAVDKVAPFESERDYLLRETHDGNAWLSPLVHLLLVGGVRELGGRVRLRRARRRRRRAGDGAATTPAPAIRRSGGSVGGGDWRGGSCASSSSVASVIRRTAFSKAASVRSEVFCTPLTLRTYWRAAASISSSVAAGSSPRSVVMFRHMPPG